jgi:hypothetical protein
MHADRTPTGQEVAAFFVGPKELIKCYEDFVRERGEAERVIRLYARDFWP